MLARILRFRRHPAETSDVREIACRLFDAGYNCAQAVLGATLDTRNSEMLAMAEPFGGGVGGSRCLCGAVSGGAMALGLKGRGHLAGRLVDAFRERNRVTCCSVLTRSFSWKSREHLANCRRLTGETAALVARLLAE